MTDHQPLTYIFKQNGLSGRAARFAIFMQNYNFQIRYKPGKSLGNADCLSRMPTLTEKLAEKPSDFGTTQILHAQKR